MKNGRIVKRWCAIAICLTITTSVIILSGVANRSSSSSWERQMLPRPVEQFLANSKAGFLYLYGVILWSTCQTFQSVNPIQSATPLCFDRWKVWLEQFSWKIMERSNQHDERRASHQQENSATYLSDNRHGVINSVNSKKEGGAVSGRGHQQLSVPVLDFDCSDVEFHDVKMREDREFDSSMQHPLISRYACLWNNKTMSEASKGKTIMMPTKCCVKWLHQVNINSSESTNLLERNNILEMMGFQIDRPLLLRNIWKSSSRRSASSTNRRKTAGFTEQQKPLSLNDLMGHPFGNLSISYFSDASKVNALRPDKVATLSEIVQNISCLSSPQSQCRRQSNNSNEEKNVEQDTCSLSSRTPPSLLKIGTQIPIQINPDYISMIAPPDIVRTLFGDRFQPHHLLPTLKGLLPAWTTVPIFLARGAEPSNHEIIESKNVISMKQKHSEQEERDNAGRGPAPKATSKRGNVRTDMHCEPIGNIAVQLHGRKRWTMVSPQYYFYLKPSISRNGRAYFYSSLDQLLPINVMLRHIPEYYELIVNEGDALWIPPWMWHRVDYIPGLVSLSASLFHFRPWEFVRNNPLYAMLVIPNLIKEVLGRNAE